MKYLKKLFSEERGVSPVIGVILMVAITVVMGAVIAGYAFGFLGNTPKTPNISLSVIDNPNDAVSLIIKHTGGESLAAGEWKYSVTKDKESAAIFPTTITSAISTGESLDLTKTTDTIPVNIAAEWYHVVAVHIVSNSILLDTNVQVR